MSSVQIYSPYHALQQQDDVEMVSEHVEPLETVSKNAKAKRSAVSDIGAKVHPIQIQPTFGLSKQATLGQEGTQNLPLEHQFQGESLLESQSQLQEQDSKVQRISDVLQYVVELLEVSQNALKRDDINDNYLSILDESMPVSGDPGDITVENAFKCYIQL